MSFREVLDLQVVEWSFFVLSAFLVIFLDRQDFSVEFLVVLHLYALVYSSLVKEANEAEALRVLLGVGRDL